MLVSLHSFRHSASHSTVLVIAVYKSTKTSSLFSAKWNDTLVKKKCNRLAVKVTESPSSRFYNEHQKLNKMEVNTVSTLTADVP